MFFPSRLFSVKRLFILPILSLFWFKGLGLLSSVNNFKAYSNAYKSLMKKSTCVSLQIRTIIGHKLNEQCPCDPPISPSALEGSDAVHESV